MKSFAFASMFAAAQALTTADLEYVQYVAKFNKQHEDVEMFDVRRANFEYVDRFINEHNAKNASWTAGHNQFSDWSEAEYKSILGYVRGELDVLTPVEEVHSDLPMADSIDWSMKGAVTPVKDQGSCASCWSFSSTGSMEAAHQIATGKLYSFSEQQLVDCAGSAYGNYGCSGGFQKNAYNYYKAGYNAMLESDYPYVGRNGDCQYNADKTTDVTVTSYTAVTPNSPSAMKKALMQQPLAVAVQSESNIFKTYSGGILNDTTCGTHLDHAILAVGYGSENGQEYFIIKNSWNTTWGEYGYGRIAIVDGEGICGINMDTLYPTTN